MNANRKWAKHGLVVLAAAGVLVTAGLLYASPEGGEAAHGVAVEAHGGAVDAAHGVAVDAHGAVEAVEGAMVADHGAAEAHGDAHGTAHGGAHGSVTPEKMKDLLWRALNFLGLVIILVKFTAKPLANALRNRRLSIKERFDDLQARKAEAEQMYKEYEGKLAGIDAEVAKIIEGAVAQAEAEKQRIIADAERAAGDIKRQAEMAVQHELAVAKKRLRVEVAEQAATMAEDLIRKHFQPADQDKLVAAYLDKVGGLQ
ncbi:MAG: ATP synthase F0 subunit B [Desulfobulbaceae bacterium]|nr:ATP synthase F0 subunit B [Desulfobulbaceae bacterium]